MKISRHPSTLTPLAQTKTSIQHNNEYIGDKELYKAILEQKYIQIHIENLLQSDPRQHIWDKYNNFYSPKFRWDLTAEERAAAEKMELSLLSNNGNMGYYDFRDAALRNMKPINGLVEYHKERAFQREQVNNQINDLLKEAGINIPKGTTLTFTINPNDFYVEVSGSDDEQLLRQVENLLNEEQNGKELYRHILKSLDNSSTQSSEDKRRKYNLLSTLRSIGYDLYTLERKDGKFLTPDGQDVFQVYLNKMRSDPYDRNYVSVAASHFGPTYYELANNGFDSIPDFTLSINFKDGKLHDVGQQTNYSETGWITTLENSLR